ncbi:MAG: right-handed parallel beta-helix repeat-containing protein [Deltaproteobacteria bacterium]|jgi:parallel beta-helix repeat protein|nr:right-handed parallel beta-helix repeat-containing protein [Deltaproteobacteria bacterium]MBW2478183.1 right-handed parallel beta-helix repeat-containing protein [Deltaproteobacteria bacterium]MBW2520323.1 right-handed parallel beta-helix repeat-containing protein [Deltaproteobacteria bacterium]
MKWILVILCCWLLPGIIWGAENHRYSGAETLIQDTVWEGEVIIDGILTVAAGVTLEIRPGTIVRFTKFDSNHDGVGEHEIFSQGTILALGTENKPILFTSAEPAPASGDWGAINMMVSEENNRLEHCIIEFGYRGFHAHFSKAELLDTRFRFNLRGAQFQESRVLIAGCQFTDNTNGLQFRDSQVTLSKNVIARSQWGVRCVYSDVIMTDCTIEDNLVNGINVRDGKLIAKGNLIVGNRRGLYVQRSQAEIVGNVLRNNSEHGIFLEDSDVYIGENRITGNGRAGVRWVNGKGKMTHNLVTKNGLYGLINDGTEPVDARQNWWGSDNLNLIALTIRDGQDRPGLGLTDYRDPLVRPLEPPNKRE